MTSPADQSVKRPVERPLSPHLQIYRPQITSVLSILHRMTGVGLTLLMMLIVAWVVSLAMGEAAYGEFISLMQHPVAQVMLFGLTFAFFYHLCAGIRHLLWDAGYFLSIESVKSTGNIVVGVSVLTTLGIWTKLVVYEGICPWLM